MKTIKIPYRYGWGLKEKHLTLFHFNQGITLCRRLGWEPSKILLSNKDYKTIQFFHPPIDTKDFFGLGIKIENGGKLNQLIFICQEKYNGIKIPREIMKTISSKRLLGRK